MTELVVSKSSTGNEYKIKDLAEADFGRMEINLAEVRATATATAAKKKRKEKKKRPEL